MYYSERFIVAGGIFEYYKYGRLICTERIGVASGGRKKNENSVKYREDTFSKARKEVKRLINANLNQWTDEEENRMTSKFLTLTFKENITDIKYANREFSKFIQRLSYNLAYKIKYLTVIEFQDGKTYKDKRTGELKKGLGRGAVHYHSVIFNMPYMPVKELQAIWGHGFVKLNKIDDVDNVGAYVCKYMTKGDDERLIGQKMYFKSTGLLQPEIINDYSQVQEYKKAFANDKPTFETEFEAPFIGKIKYAQYNTNKIRKVVK